jgi:YggT family protein
MIFAVRVVNTLVSLLSLLIFVYSLLSFFMDPYHPVRRTLSQIIEPLLAPIRRVIPPVGGLDFSPLVLIIILQVLGALLRALLLSLA